MKKQENKNTDNRKYLPLVKEYNSLKEFFDDNGIMLIPSRRCSVTKDMLHAKLRAIDKYIMAKNIDTKPINAPDAKICKIITR